MDSKQADNAKGPNKRACIRVSMLVKSHLSGAVGNAVLLRKNWRRTSKCIALVRGREYAVHGRRMVTTRAVEEEAEEAEEAALSDEYSDEMQKKMGTSLVYRHEDGMNYNRIIDDIIVGSCPQVAEDVDTLVTKEGVTMILCLQRDSDMEYFSLDINPIIARCEELGTVRHVRLGINDFDPFNLRLRLPEIIPEVAKLHKDLGGTLYVHCTAGMGRAPATALAYMWWCKGMELDAAYELLLSKRRCSPKLYAIRQATDDILYGGTPQEVTIVKRGSSMSKVVEIAGLDVGWYNRIPMTRVEGRADTWSATRSLLPGRYPYKFVMDDVWSYDADMATFFDGENVNNYEEVFPVNLSEADHRARKRVLSDGGTLTPQERERLGNYIASKQ